MTTHNTQTPAFTVALDGDTLVAIPDQPRGFELHGERRTPGAPCLKCGARALTGSEFCFAHATTEERGAIASVEPVDSWLTTDQTRDVA